MSRPAALEVDPKDWRDTALEYIEARVRAGHTVTADDLRRDLPAPHHHNQYGAAFTVASSRKLIEMQAGGPSKTRSRHGGHRGVWRLHPEQLAGVTR